MVKTMKNQNTLLWGAISVIVAVLLTVAVYHGVVIPQNYVEQDDYDALYNSYIAAQSRITQLSAPLPDVTLSIDNVTFDHTSTVNASDDVAADTWVNRTITISNDESTAQTFTLALRATGRNDGLPDALVSDYFQMYIYNSGDDGRYWLFGKGGNGAYTSGWTATIPAEATWTRTLSTFFEKVDDEFKDGMTHNIYVYLIINGRVIDKLSLTLTT